MKYDDLEAFKEYLYNRVSNANTVRKYYSAVAKLFRDVGIGADIKRLDISFYQRKIPEIFKTRNEVSAVKNGLKYFREFIEVKRSPAGGSYTNKCRVMESSKNSETVCSFPEEDFYHEINRKKRNRSVKPRKVLYMDEIQRKINQIQDEKTKYAFRLALISGLRVSELAGLDASEIDFEDGLIYVNVTNGKGGSNGIVTCLPDPYLYDRLQKYAEIHPEGRLFYSESTLRKRAWELGLECHDFRRIFAITKRNELKKQMPVSEANEEVKNALRHKRFSTTKRYLFNRKLVIKREKGEMKA